jgi:death-on-curing family protein
MDYIAKDLSDEFLRLEKKIGPEIYDQDKCIGIYDVLKAHFLVVDFFAHNGEGVGGVGPRDINLLHSALNRQLCGYQGEKKWKTDFHLCATLFFGLIKDHPFYDANKRTAFLSLLFHLWKINRTPDIEQKEFERLAIRVA